MLKLLEEIRVILIDDDALFCRNMRDLFDAQPGVRIKLVKAYLSAAAALRELHRTLPDVVLLDQKLKGHFEKGTAVIPVLHARRPGIKVILVTGYLDAEVQQVGRAAGARGFVTKPFTPRGLFAMIRDVFEGGTATHSASSSAIVLEAAQATSAHQTPLTARESEIRQLHEAGKSRKEIASELGLKEPTVNAHLHSVFVKEGIGRRRPTR